MNLPFLVLGMLASLAGAAPESPWKRLDGGLEFRIMDGGAVCRDGSPGIAVVRFDPERWRIDLFHYSEEPGATQSRDIAGWQARTGAAVIFNAGQYYPDRRPMGLFMKGGRNLGTRRLKDWKGLLVAEPGGIKGIPRARIFDLDHETFDASTTPYGIVLQSFMILDRDGRKRVRRSDWRANRTVVAADRRGRLLVLHTEGAYTLWELADWLSRSDLDVREAMAMDGGFEAQMSVRSGGTEYLSFGQWHVDDRGDHSMPGVHSLLPAAVGLFPREAGRSPAIPLSGGRC